MIDRVLSARLPKVDRRKLVVTAALAFLAACKTTPSGPPIAQPPPDRPIPIQTEQHRVAVIVPLTGSNAAVGQSIANAARMAVADTGAKNLRLTTYDSSIGAAAAAQGAVADGNKLILGPLLGEHAPAVAGVARPARVPVISFSNDTTVAGRDVYIMGQVPEQALRRTVSYARSQNVARFGALIPNGEYGQRLSAAMLDAVRDTRGTIVAMETYDRSAASIAAAARRLNARGPVDAVLIADGARIAAQAAPLLKAGRPGLRILGTELWSGESIIPRTPALRGAWFSAVSDARYRQFADSYRTRFGAPPHRIATLGYDAVLLTLRIARDWQPGTTLPTGRLTDSGGFIGLDGAFRFDRGVVERALEVREVRAGAVPVVSPAPAKFGG